MMSNIILFTQSPPTFVDSSILSRTDKLTVEFSSIGTLFAEIPGFLSVSWTFFILQKIDPLRSIETSLVCFSVPICQFSVFPATEDCRNCRTSRRGRLLCDPEDSGCLGRSGLFQGVMAKNQRSIEAIRIKWIFHRNWGRTAAVPSPLFQEGCRPLQSKGRRTRELRPICL